MEDNKETSGVRRPAREALAEAEAEADVFKREIGSRTHLPRTFWRRSGRNMIPVPRRANVAAYTELRVPQFRTLARLTVSRAREEKGKLQERDAIALPAL